MFERFSDEARELVVLAQDEARRLRHGYIGTEHLLLGLLRQEHGIAARVLRRPPLTVEGVRAEVTRIVGEREEAPRANMPFTPPAKRVLQLALRESLAFGHDDIRTEHVLLGVSRESDGIGARILRAAGLDYEAVRCKVAALTAGAGPHFPFVAPSVFRPTWEYRLVAVGDAKPSEKALDALGREGWELAAVLPPPAVRLVFKRQRSVAS